MINQEAIDEARDSIVDFIIQRRKNMKLTQIQLAKRAGVSTRTLQRIESEKYIAQADNLLKICYALDCYFFFAEKENDTPVLVATDDLFIAIQKRQKKTG
ncbi:MAG: helix-turn-helix transcriptional regulator [Bacteroidota bacterium]